MDWNWTSFLQGVISNAAWWILLGVLGVIVAVLKKKRSEWLSPVLYGLMGMILFGAVLYSGSMYSRWPQLTPLILILSLILAAGLHFISVRVEHKSQSTPQGDSEVKHWKDEVDRVRTKYKKQAADAEDKLKDFQSPRGKLKVKRGEWHMLGKIGLDVTETLDQMILDDKLVLNTEYRHLFFPDPMKGVRKHLTIEFSHGTNEFEVTVPENTLLTLPFPYDVIK